MIGRRELLAGAPALLLGQTRRPNVLWLMTDEHRPDSLACYGSKWAHSPHLDDLAASTTGVLHNEARLPNNTRFLTWRFEDAGYQTASFGKKHYFFKGRQAFQTEGGSPTEGVVDPTRYGRGYNPADHDAVFYPQKPGQKQLRNWILAGKFPAPVEQSAEARNVALAQDWLSARDASRPFSCGFR